MNKLYNGLNSFQMLPRDFQRYLKEHGLSPESDPEKYLSDRKISEEAILDETRRINDALCHGFLHNDYLDRYLQTFFKNR